MNIMELAVTTYCKHGEYIGCCLEPGCEQSFADFFNARYLLHIPSRTALAARVADDLRVLIGFLTHDQINAEVCGEDRSAIRLIGEIICLEHAYRIIKAQVQ